MLQAYGDWDGYEQHDMDAGSGDEYSCDVRWMHSRDQCDTECGSSKDTTMNRDGTPRIWDDADMPSVHSDNDSDNVRVDVCMCVRVGMCRRCVCVCVCICGRRGACRSRFTSATLRYLSRLPPP